MKVAFQGTKGAYSEQALKKYFVEEAQAIGFELSEQVCEAVLADEVAMGILPVENSIVGNVAVNSDLLYEHDFFVIGECYLQIKHNLLVRPGVKLEEIKAVHSHPIALAQCRDFLNRHNIRAISDYDTAGACKNLVRRKSSDEGTIASSLCEEYYDIEILNDDIQKVKNNFTRFLVFVKKDKIPEGLIHQKTSIAFCTNHNPGALLNCLQEFASCGINLTKIESRPIPENPFMYTFFVDFMGSITDSKVKECLINLQKDTKTIKVIGSYPEGKLDF